MRARCILALLLLTANTLAQSTPPSCAGDHPVDEIISEIKKQQSKKNNRNKNPLPETVCIFGWCSKVRKPSNAPRSTSTEETPVAADTSSSKTAAAKCNDVTDRAVEAAHNVEVGDYYFDQKSYRASFLRYQEASEQKPGDAAIHVRLGRAFEKLNQLPQAIENYQTAEKLGGPDKWTQEAHAALARLH